MALEVMGEVSVGNLEASDIGEVFRVVVDDTLKKTAFVGVLNGWVEVKPGEKYEQRQLIISNLTTPALPLNTIVERV